MIMPTRLVGVIIIPPQGQTKKDVCRGAGEDTVCVCMGRVGGMLYKDRKI